MSEAGAAGAAGGEPDAGGGSGGSAGTLASPDAGSGGSGGSGVNDTGGRGGFGASGVSGGMTPIEGEDEPPMCAVGAGDHAAADCALDSCPFATDAVLACNHRNFGEYGLQVAATPSGAVLVSVSAELSFMLSASGGDGELHELPSALGGYGTSLGQAQDGAIFLAANSDRVSVYGEEAGEWIAQDATMPRSISGPYDFEIAADGTMHLWIENEPDLGYEHLTRAPAGEWIASEELLAHPDGYTRWTLDRDGAPIAVTDVQSEASYVLEWRRAGVASSLGQSRDSGGSSFRVASPAVPQAGEGAPAVAAVLQTGLGLSVAWSSTDAAEGFLEVAVPDSTALVGTCNRLQDFLHCDADCMDQSSGVAGVALTQASDGALWLVWSVTRQDILYDYEAPEPACVAPFPGECFCNTTVVDRGARATLHVARIDVATGELTEVLTMPTMPLQLDQSPAPTLAQAGAIDARAFGDRLAIGMRTQVAEPGTRTWLAELRLIELDTSAF